jgi:Ser/Thr protein kinase RdoA (MazF antagonist)
MVDPILQRVMQEFGLGSPFEQESLSGGSAAAFHVRSARGDFVIKDGGDERVLGLYKQVAETLNAQGVRQARLYESIAGQLTASSGHAVFAFLPGTWAWRPTTTQSAAFMRYFAAYQRALRAVPIPLFVTEVRTPWQQADSLDYLLHDLPGLLATIHVSPLFARTADRVLAFLAEHRPILDAQPKQLVHGDVGPGNILYAHDGGTALIDFTPYRESALYALDVSFYWHYVYANHGRPDVMRIRDDLRAYAAVHPWTDEAKRAFYPALVKAAARILFVPILLALATGQRMVDSDSDSRARAINNIMACRNELEAAIRDT